MNQNQILSVLQSFLMIIGTSLFVSRGLMKPEDLTSLMGVIMPVLGAIMTAAPVILGIWRNTHKQTIAAAASLPKVEAIVMNDQTAADKVPSGKVVGPDQVSGDRS